MGIELISGQRSRTTCLTPVIGKGVISRGFLNRSSELRSRTATCCVRPFFPQAEDSDDSEPLGNNGHGEIYILRFPVETQQGSATVLTAWIIRDGEDFPRLITCYIL